MSEREMTWEEWEKEFPPKVVQDRPHGEAFSTRREAEGQREFREQVDEVAYWVVQYGDEFFVVPAG